MPDTPNSATSLARRLALPAVVLLALVALTAFLFIGGQDGGQVQAQAGSGQDPAADTAASSGS